MNRRIVEGEPVNECSREIVADYKQHLVGEREIVDWDRPDGYRYYDVPLVYLREASEAEYLLQQPKMTGHISSQPVYFWEVSID